TALREENDLFISHEDLLREAFMRNMIRTSIKENHDKILIICGAWHIPALKLDGNAKQDKSLTSQLPKVKVSVTWVPWTNNRLSTKSGYGAGIKNPGWYHYKWQYPSDDGSIWITKVADLLRNKTNHPISTADIMECLRLAHQLATLRNHSEIKLHDMNDAAVAVFCGGNETSLKLIEDNLLIGEQIGVIPSSSPKVLLLVDYENRVKKLRLKLQSDEKIIVLDLRNNNDLARSIFFHQLHLLNVPLGKKQQIRSKGTFKEEWLIRWEPEVIVSLIEKSYWGNSVAEAALSFSMAKIKSSADFLVLISILQESLYADLPTLTEYSIQAISEWTTEHTNIEQLLSTIPSLVNVIKYGNVRNTDSVLLSKLSYTLIIRICVNLSNTLTQVDDEQAATLQKSLQDFHFSIRLLNQEPINQLWHKTLLQLKESSSIHPFIHGYCIQLSSLEKLIAPAELEIIVSQALSKNYNTIDSAKWIEGFLKNSVLTLLFDDMIWNVFDHWISSLNDADFKEILPLLRKAFSHFAPNDRIKIVQKVKTKNTSIHIVDAEFDGHQTSNDKINELFTTFIKQLIFD
ncbi:MAG: hypothetical protein KA010_03975, partial [Saprospiraceae bacterium]|nr:hypothetical protein [Saprospiraceae bacterium]